MGGPTRVPLIRFESDVGCPDSIRASPRLTSDHLALGPPTRSTHSLSSGRLPFTCVMTVPLPAVSDAHGTVRRDAFDPGVLAGSA